MAIHLLNLLILLWFVTYFINLSGVQSVAQITNLKTYTIQKTTGIQLQLRTVCSEQTTPYVMASSLTAHRSPMVNDCFIKFKQIVSIIAQFNNSLSIVALSIIYPGPILISSPWYRKINILKKQHALIQRTTHYRMFIEESQYPMKSSAHVSLKMSSFIILQRLWQTDKALHTFWRFALLRG